MQILSKVLQSLKVWISEDMYKGFTVEFSEVITSVKKPEQVRTHLW